MITSKIKALSSISKLSRKMSVLYMTGDKAKDAYSPISPYIDLKSVFSDEKSIKDNLKFRNSNINFTEFMNKYHKFNKMFMEKQNLEKLRDDVSSQLKSLQKSSNSGIFFPTTLNWF